jgi:chorismate synthase
MLRFMTAGESHGRALIGLIESFPAGFPLSTDAIDHELTRRRQGYGRGPRMRLEQDRAIILSGLRHGRTLGSPIAIMIENRDRRPEMTAGRRKARSSDSPITVPRPGHADLAGAVKFATHDVVDVLERASARETAVRVACGAVARQLLEHFGIGIVSHTIAIGPVAVGRKRYTFEEIIAAADDSPVRCVDTAAAVRMMRAIKDAVEDRDTLGGIFEVRASGLPIGLGSNAQWYLRLDGALAAALMSIPSVKGVEVGDGFAAGRRRGSRVHDAVAYDPRRSDEPAKGLVRKTNAAGGIEGGMTNGAEIVLRAACKPIATLKRPLATIDLITKAPARALVTRADVCIVPAAGVVGEAMTAMVLASAFTAMFGNDSLRQIEDSVRSYRRWEL